jgi:hypothetical protein
LRRGSVAPSVMRLRLVRLAEVVLRRWLAPALPLKAAGTKQRLAEQPDDLGRVDPMPGLPPQLLADRLSDRIGDQHLG